MTTVFKIQSAIGTALGYALAALFPPQQCISCGRESLYIPLCKKCREELKDFALREKNRCTRCGRILISEKHICMECRAPNPNAITHLDGVFPLYPYILWKKDLLFAWKIEGMRSLSPFFAFLVHEALNAVYPNIPPVPVPPRPWKIFREGRDQIDELCRFLHGLYGTPVLKVLKRLSSRQQKKLNRSERLCRSEKRYVLKKRPFLPRSFVRSPPEAAVLIDDIVTTGATLDVCAQLLKQAGVKRVYALTLFSC